MLNVNYVHILEKSGLFRYVNADEHEDVTDKLHMTSMKFVNNQVIFRQNEKTAQIGIVLDGEVKAEKIHGSGSDNMVHTYVTGEVFAYEGVFSKNRAYPMDYISDGDSYIAFVDLEQIKKSSAANEILQGLTVCMANDSIARLHRIEIISKKKLRDRILTYLRINVSETGMTEITLNSTREQLAQELCVNRSALSKELSEMQRVGIIKIDRRKITLL